MALLRYANTNENQLPKNNDALLLIDSHPA